MNAAVVTKFGPPGMLKILERPVPEVGEGEVLIRTKAIGMNFSDVFARMGYYPGVPRPPFVPGIELSGVIERAGKGVKAVKRRDRVLAFPKLGAYAEYVCIPATHAIRMPKKMSFEEGAAFGVAALTAYHGLVTLAHIRAEEKLLLHAAAGGVGTAAVQLAKHLGAEVYATASSAEKLEVARNQGANHLINYRTEDFAEIISLETNGYGVDVILDSVGGRVFRKGWRPWIYPPSIVSKNVSVSGFNLFFLTHKVEYFGGVLRELFKLYEKKVLKPVIGAKFPFDQIAEAQAFLQSRKSFGKVVVMM
jgi:NADPH2:quinone reductase